MNKKILVALNSFKQTGSSLELGTSFAHGLVKACPSISIDVQPMADGGDGTLDIFRLTMEGKLVSFETVNSHGEKIVSPVFIDKTKKFAFVEIAQISGLARTTKTDFLNTNSYGTGLVILKLIKSGFKDILIGIGGTSMIDLALGALIPLGLKVEDEHGKEFIPTTGTLNRIKKIDNSEVLRLLKNKGVKISTLSDTNMSISGKQGTWDGTISKGGTLKDKSKIKKDVLSVIKTIKSAYGINLHSKKFIGCGGGSVGGLFALANAKTMLGTDFVITRLGLEEKIKNADLVVTGEGMIDQTTFWGKAPYRILQIAKKYNKPVAIITGNSRTTYEELCKRGFDFVLRTEIGDIYDYPHKDKKETKKILYNTGFNFGSIIARFI